MTQPATEADRWLDAQTIEPWSTDVRLFNDNTGIVVAYVNGQPQFIRITWALEELAEAASKAADAMKDLGQALKEVEEE